MIVSPFSHNTNYSYCILPDQVRASYNSLLGVTFSSQIEPKVAAQLCWRAKHHGYPTFLADEFQWAQFHNV